jgi:dolichol-phosphate mannosyltransferase
VDIVVASPYHPHGRVLNVPPYRRTLSRTASLLYRALVERRIHTYTSMFRAYRGHVVRTVRFDDTGFLAVAELLVNAIRSGHRVTEYPSTLRARMEGSSKARLARITAAHLRFMAGLAVARICRDRSHARPVPDSASPAQ